MAKIKCPGCGAEVDTDSGTAEFTPPAAALDAAASGPVASRDDKHDDSPQATSTGNNRNPSRFWRRND